MSAHPPFLQLDVTGEPVCWLNYKRAAYYYTKGMVAWSIGSNGYTLLGGHNRIGVRSFLDLNTIIAVQGETSDAKMHRVPNLSNTALFRRDQMLCAYCGNIFRDSELTRDHVKPKSRGGKDKWENVVTACGGCNKLKDNRYPEEADMKLLYVPYTPNRAEHMILMKRDILADQMEFLLKKVTKNSRLLNPPKFH